MRPRPTKHARGRAALALLGLGIVAGGGCSAGDPAGPAATSTSGTTPGTGRPVVNPTIRLPKSTTPPGVSGSTPGSVPPPTISDFTVDKPRPCDANDPTTTSVVRFTTSGADRVVLVVDDVQLPDTPPLSGELTVTLPCDRNAHYVAIIAANPANEIADDKRFVPGALPAS